MLASLWLHAKELSRGAEAVAIPIQEQLAQIGRQDNDAKERPGERPNSQKPQGSLIPETPETIQT